jgi:glycosyltransferase involved in cell wall biosynthesis
MPPTTSVIVPTFDRAGFVGAAIESVRHQTVTDWELIVVDDGSTDETAAALRRYEGCARIVHQRNRGVAAARNHGLRLARGTWVAFLDSDDAWEPGWLAATHARAAAEPGEISGVVTAASQRTADRTPLEPAHLTAERLGPIDLLTHRRGPVRGCALLARRDEVLAVGGFDETRPVTQDYHLLVRLALRAPLAVVREPLLRYTVHEASLTGQFPATNHLGWLRLIDDLRQEHPEFAKRHRRTLARRRRSHHRRCAAALLAAATRGAATEVSAARHYLAALVRGDLSRQVITGVLRAVVAAGRRRRTVRPV